MQTPSTTVATRSLSLAERRLLAELPPIIGLEPGESLRIGEVRDAVALVTSPPTLKAARLLTPELTTGDVAWRTIERLAHEALLQLAIARAWRALKTDGPPWSAMTGNAFWNALVNAGIVAPQALIDRIRRAVFREGLDPSDPRAPWTSWRTKGSVPRPLERVRDIGAGRHLVREEGEPWLAGCYLDDQIVVLGYGNGEGFAIRPFKTVKRADQSLIVYEIRTSAKLPETILAAAVGRSVTGIVDEKLVQELGGTIVAYDTKARTARLRVETAWPPTPDIPIEHARELAKQFDRVMGRVKAVAIEVERSINGAEIPF